MSRRAAKVIVGLTAICASLLPLTACSQSTTTSHGSRVQIYKSDTALANDSSVVVAVTVANQTVTRDIDEITDFTLSNVSVNEVAKGAVSPGATLVVRQFGTQEFPGPADMLQVGESYLLYLTASGLTGDLASQYYVTGGTAGLYEANDPGAAADPAEVQYTHVESDDPDKISTEITVDDVQG